MTEKLVNLGVAIRSIEGIQQVRGIDDYLVNSECLEAIAILQDIAQSTCTGAVNSPVRKQLEDALGCFNAAIAEGLYDRLVEQEPVLGGLRDLIERRLLFAQSHIMAAIDLMGDEPAAPTCNEAEAVQIVEQVILMDDDVVICDSYEVAKAAIRALADKGLIKVREG